MKDNKRPLMSIITVCFNSEKTIERTIKSVLEQNYDNYEYLIIDGGSADATMEIVKKYEPDFAGKLKYISEKDNGIYDAMNKGIKKSQGDIIGIINSDDWYCENAFEIISKNYIKKDKYSVYYGMIRRCFADGREHSIWFQNSNTLGDFSIPHPSVFITAQTYKKFGLYSEEYKIASDFELLLKYSKINDIKFHPVYHILANFQIGGISSNNKTMYNSIIEHLNVKYKYGVINERDYRRLNWRLRIKKFLCGVK